MVRPPSEYQNQCGCNVRTDRKAFVQHINCIWKCLRVVVPLSGAGATHNFDPRSADCVRGIYFSATGDPASVAALRRVEVARLHFNATTGLQPPSPPSPLERPTR